MSHKKFFIAISVFVLLCLLATPVWAEKCKQVTIVHGEFVSYLQGPENCDGYDGCWAATVRGTPNGLYTTYWFDANIFQVKGDTIASVQDTIIETQHGDLYMRESLIADYAAPDGFAVHSVIVGGTGQYEGATGWMGGYGDIAGTLVRNGGEICWPDEE